MNGVLEFREAFPGRFRKIAPGPRRIARFLGELHRRDVARAVGKDRARAYAYDQLRADRLREQGVVGADDSASVHAQAARFLEVDEEQAHPGIDRDIAEALEHSVAVEIGESKLGGADHPYETRRAALERAIRPALSIRGRKEKVARAFDEILITLGELRAGGDLFQPVGDLAALEPILQPAVSLVVKLGVGHESSSLAGSRAETDAPIYSEKQARRAVIPPGNKPAGRAVRRVVGEW